MSDDTKPAAPAADDARDLLIEALDRYQRGYDAARENMEAAYEDLAFLAGDGQWDARARAEREEESRPCLTVDKSSQFVRQVTGDMRQMRPAIKVTAVDDRGSADVAEKLLPGMIRFIEQRSDAQAAYFNAADQQVAAGIGHWRVTTEYAGTETFLQEIRIAPIEDGIAVVWDPDSMLPTREDAMWCFVPVDMSRQSFEERWPGKSADALDNTDAEAALDWCTPDKVRVAEYWVKVPMRRRLARLPGGGIDDVTDDEAAEADAIAAGGTIEERDDFKVQRTLISASAVLEGPDDWPGRHIPIVPLIGEEIKIGATVVRRGIIRTLKEPQRIYNYAVSAQTEVIALQPKAPFTGTEKMFERHRDQWETANSKNWPYLEYDVDPQVPGGRPERVQPPVSSQGIGELLALATGDMSGVTGIYPASLGQASNETSGRAIMARQREGDTGTFVYVDGFARALRRTGRILLDLIPHIYDSERTIRIVGEDGKIDQVRINREEIDPNGDGIGTHVLNDVTVGAYDLAIELGPSFASAKAEARDGMQAFMQAAPQAAGLFIDLFARMQDWPLADQIAKRAGFLLPPAVKAAEAAESGEPQPPPPPPDPAQQAAAQAEQAKAQLEQMKLQLEAAKLQVDREKIAADREKVQAEMVKAQLDVQAAQAGQQGASGAGPALDPRVDQLAQAVETLGGMIEQILEVVAEMRAGGAPPPEPAPMDGGQGGMPPPGPPSAAAAPVTEPPPGGFSMPAGVPQGGPPQG
ncbi:hypothetical protein A33M_3331 [Rhodovulum sp. PH10]|uniref:portal protein n=1 Tax=Rhodovulum sp. PH10 TaxID=1187851 RepID=UPI00027C2929|nr:portal protein [Rhodovulum sp. PH10]EJW11253.1 hypothetical protein A33M_3331 [Rhodovulum sp. PH10]